MTVILEVDDTEHFNIKKIKKSRCLSCGEELVNFGLLVCMECFDDDCEKFERLSEVDEK